MDVWAKRLAYAGWLVWGLWWLGLLGVYVWDARRECETETGAAGGFIVEHSRECVAPKGSSCVMVEQPNPPAKEPSK